MRLDERNRFRHCRRALPGILAFRRPGLIWHIRSGAGRASDYTLLRLGVGFRFDRTWLQLQARNFPGDFRGRSYTRAGRRHYSGGTDLLGARGSHRRNDGPGCLCSSAGGTPRRPGNVVPEDDRNILRPRSGDFVRAKTPDPRAAAGGPGGVGAFQRPAHSQVATKPGPDFAL